MDIKIVTLFRYGELWRVRAVNGRNCVTRADYVRLTEAQHAALLAAQLLRLPHYLDYSADKFVPKVQEISYE